MRKQQQVWFQEHTQEKTLPGIGYKQEPSSYVKKFRDFLHEKHIEPPKKIIDIGCGKGRNAIYLAEEGFEVYAIDYIELAIDTLKGQIKSQHLETTIHPFVGFIDKKWPFKDNFFDIAIDNFSSIDIETKAGREKYRDELYRCLKPQGYALVSVVSTNDVYERAIMDTYPGEEKNSSYWPENGKYQKNYDEIELREFYKNFTLIELKEITKPAFKLGKNYDSTNYWLVLQKP